MPNLSEPIFNMADNSPKTTSLLKHTPQSNNVHILYNKSDTPKAVSLYDNYTPNSYWYQKSDKPLVSGSEVITLNGNRNNQIENKSMLECSDTRFEAHHDKTIIIPSEDSSSHRPPHDIGDGHIPSKHDCIHVTSDSNNSSITQAPLLPTNQKKTLNGMESIQQNTAQVPMLTEHQEELEKKTDDKLTEIVLHQSNDSSGNEGTRTQSHTQGTLLSAPSTVVVNPAPSLKLTLSTLAVSYFWIGPLVVMFWCYSWNLILYCVGPLMDSNRFSSMALAFWLCTAFGKAVFITATLFQSQICTFVSNLRYAWARVLLSRVYIYVVSVACVSQWIGVWGLQDLYFQVTLESVSFTLALSSVILLLMRCYSSGIGPPVKVHPDWPLESNFIFTTVFGCRTGSLRHVLDTILTVLVVNTLVVTVWRTTWELMDLELYPDDTFMSGLVTLAISYSLALLLAFVQFPVQKLSANLDSAHWAWKLVIEDIFVFLQSNCQITHWRGFWLLMDHYDKFRPESLYVCHVVAFLLLTFSMASQNLIVRGCNKDGGRTQGEAIRLNTSLIPSLTRVIPLRANRSI